MRKYLSTLHQRPVHHRKRFALAVSGGFTLVIFAIWCFVTFNSTSSTVATQPTVSGDSSLEVLRANAVDSFNTAKNQIQDIKQNLNGQ